MNASTSVSNDFVRPPRQRKCNYFNERVFARSAGQRRPTKFPPRHQAGDGGLERESSSSSSKWSAAEIIAELQHKKANSPHLFRTENPLLHPLPAPRPDPKSVYGLEIDELDDYYSDLVARSKKVKEPPYERNGRMVQQLQRETIPILLVAIASFPIPVDFADPITLAAFETAVINAAEKRYGSCLQSIILHMDEGFPHYHLVVSDEGRPVKPFHSGFATQKKAERAGIKNRKVLQGHFLAGCVAVQDWYEQAVGRLMGWARKSAKPKRKKGHAAQIAYNLELALRTNEDLQATIKEEDERRRREDKRAAERDRKAAVEYQERLAELERFAADNRRTAAENVAVENQLLREKANIASSTRIVGRMRKVQAAIWGVMPEKERQKAGFYLAKMAEIDGLDLGDFDAVGKLGSGPKRSN